MTNKELDRFIHKAIHGCSHQAIGVGFRGLWVCEDCRMKLWREDVVEEYTRDKDFKIVATYYTAKIPTYLEHGKPWGDLLNWAMKQEWWVDFVGWYEDRVYVDSGSIVDMLANPRSLAEHIAEYLEGLKDENT